MHMRNDIEYKMYLQTRNNMMCIIIMTVMFMNKNEVEKEKKYFKFKNIENQNLKKEFSTYHFCQG